MRAKNIGFLSTLPVLAFAVMISGCSGGGSSPPSGNGNGNPTQSPTTTPTSTPVGTPTATPNASNKTTVALVAGQPITLPSLPGYAASLTMEPAPGTSFAPGSTITAGLALGAPSGAPSVSARAHRFTPSSPTVLFSVEFSFSEPETLLYSLSSTIAGATQGTSYTAETFDQTTGTEIAEIVALAGSGGSVTFADPTAFGVVAGDQYITEVFLTPAGATVSPTAPPTATPTATPSASPTPSTTTNLFLAAGQGVAEYNSGSGGFVEAFATSYAANVVGADNSGDIYAFGTNSSPNTLVKVAIGGSTALASYTPTSKAQFGFGVSPAGEVVIGGNTGSDFIFDEWDPGATGAPSRSISYTEPSGEYTFAIGSTGSLYIPYLSTKGLQEYDVIPAGQKTATRTISEAIAKAKSGFTVNEMAVAPDGTLYVGEWSSNAGDPNAGLYVYLTSGTENEVTSMDPGISGIDFDGSSNVYVASDNFVYSGSASGPDTAEQLSIYTPHAAALSQQFNDGVPGVESLTVADNGEAYLDQFAGFASNAPSTNGNIYVVQPGASTSSLLIPNVNTFNTVLFNGTAAKEVRSPRSFYSSLGSHNGSFLRH